MSGRRAFGGLVLGAACATFGCGAREPAADALREPRDVILVTLDTTRFDRTAIAGRNDVTPHLARLAEEGVSFLRAYAPSPLTLPSHASLLSGRSPVAHGVRINGTARVPDDVPLLAERFRAAGFATGAFVSSMVLEARYGLARGFERYDAPAAGARERAGADTAARAIAWLEETVCTPDARVFLWLHVYDPHAPYEPPADFAALEPYDGEVAAADAALGGLLAALHRLGRVDDALIVACADHGEGLGDHGEDEHGIFLYEEQVHVPLVVRLPGQAFAGRRIDRVASLVDVAPTLLALSGLDALPCEGRDLRPWLRGEGAGDGERAAYAESWLPFEAYGHAPLFARIEQRWKYIEAPRPELYDLLADAEEHDDVAKEFPGDAARLAARLAGERAAGARAAHGTDEVVDVTREERAGFEQLGYVQGGGGGAGGADALDPKDGIVLHNQLRAANTLLAHGRAEDAIVLLEQIRARDPGQRLAAVKLAQALSALGRHEEGAAVLEAMLARHATFFEGWLELGIVLGRVDPARAVAPFEEASALQPDNFEAWFDLALAREQSEDLAGARAAYERAVALDRSGRALNALAWLLATAPPPVGDAHAAVAFAREAVAAGPANAEYHDTLAEALAATGAAAGAVDAMREAIRLDASHPAFGERLRAFEALANGRPPR